MKLIPIPKEKYNEYRLTLMFDCYKWDPQFLDNNTIAKYALVITKEEHEELQKLTEDLDRETRAAEEFLNRNLELAKPLALPKKISKEIKKMKNYEPDKHVRLMRYDFHPTVEGKWAVSEVNSDVPGGFAESSFMQRAAIEVLDSTGYWYQNFGEILVNAICKKVPDGGKIVMVHCTCYSDDRQVMQFLGDRLREKGYQVIYAAADHLRFQNHTAYSILDGNEGKVDAIFRFTPLEWLTEMRPKRWQGYFDTTTVCCNHPVAMFAQTKRFPLVWKVLEKRGLHLSAWRELLPDTSEVKAAKGKEGYIYKPACGRVGEKISIKEACRDDEYKKIMKDVKRHPKKYLAQKKFHSSPLVGEKGEEFHVCLGSYAVDGKHAGYYARISKSPRIDSNAADIPVLIEGESCSAIPMPSNEEESCSSIPTPGIEGVRGMTGKEIFRIWAPDGKKWTDWVRPVPFVGINAIPNNHIFSGLTVPAIDIPDEMKAAVAFIIDLPGAESVTAGIALAKAGFRPIPIYNGTMEQQCARATVDNQEVSEALVWGAKELEDMRLKDDALPAFLTDTNRLNQFKMAPGIFDNSWDVYPQDLPSAEYFVDNGVDKIVIIGDKVAKDLKKILYKFQKKKIQIYLMKEYGVPKKITLHRPLQKDMD